HLLQPGKRGADGPQAPAAGRRARAARGHLLARLLAWSLGQALLQLRAPLHGLPAVRSPLREALHAPEAVRLVPVEPGVDGIGIARLEQAVAGDRMRRHPRRDLEQGRTAFAHPGTPVVVTMVFQLLALRLRQAQSSAWGHHTLLSPVPQ